MSTPQAEGDDFSFMQVLETYNQATTLILQRKARPQARHSELVAVPGRAAAFLYPSNDTAGAWICRGDLGFALIAHERIGIPRR
jgi:hypothetical protein